MPDNSYQSLLSMARDLNDKLVSDPRVMKLILYIQEGFRDNGHQWNFELINQKNKLKKIIESICYGYYSEDKSSVSQALNIDEQKKFIENIQSSIEQENNFNIRAQGYERIAFSQLTEQQLENTFAFRILPKNRNQRQENRSRISARITLKVNKASFNKLWDALILLFKNNPPEWLNQAKIMGPKAIGNRTDDAVIYFYESSLEHAEEIRARLLQSLDSSDFIEHSPIGMYHLDKGISYSETPEGQSSSHGESRSRIIASALTQSLLSNESIEEILPQRLQANGYNINEPALASQAWHDLNIKAGLGGSLVYRNGQASPDIWRFISNPLEFSSKNAISGDRMTSMGRLPVQGRVQLVQIAPNSYAIEYVYQPSQQGLEFSARSYFLGYNGANPSIKSPAYVDIPINALEESFLFTGTLTGCSVIVTQLNDTTYRVYHDGRVNSSTLYDNVVMAYDFRDYQVPGTDEGMGMVYMRFKDGQWQLILQKQEYQRTADNIYPVLRRNEAAISGLYADENWSVQRQEQFLSDREQIHNKLKELAARYRISTENITDGIYVEGEFSLIHPAMEPWLNLIDQIRVRAEETHTTNDSLFLLNEARSVLSQARTAERNWLWLQIKNKQGFDAVVQVNPNDLGSGLSHISVDRQYELAVQQQIINNNSEFNGGNEQYQDIVINDFNKDLTSSEMKSLYLNGILSGKEYGALYHHIEDTLAKEYMNNVLKQTDKVNTLFQHKGAISSRLAPQDFYLPLMGDDSGGRCYPLVRAMAVALSQKGSAGANVFLDKLFLAAASPTDESTVLIKRSLESLHSNREAIQASSSIGELHLNDIRVQLFEESAVKMYALNTSTHAMLLGKVVNEGNTSFYFYDPNFGLFTFDSREKLFSALNEFMVKDNMASAYYASGSPSTPTFELIAIDTDAMADVKIGNGIRVTDLSNSIELHQIANERAEFNRFIESQANIAKDAQIQSSLEILKAEQWGERITEAYNEITVKNNLEHEWLPNFSNIEVTEEGKYRIQFIHQSDTLETLWVETEDKTFIEFNDYFSEHIGSFGAAFSFENNEFQRGLNINEVDAADGMNSGIAMYSLFQYISNKNRQNVEDGSPSNLKTALKIHAYVGYTMMAQGAISDVSKFAKLVHTLWKEGAGVEKATMETFSSSLARTVGEKLGIGLQIFAVGLDAYELANANTEAQREVFGTQLAFDSGVLATSGIEYGVALTGVESLEGAVGPLAVPLMGIGIGATALVQINARHTQETLGVAAYFAHLKNGYENAQLVYDEKSGLILHAKDVVYKSIDFRRGEMELDSQFIYRGRNGIKWHINGRWISELGQNPSSDDSEAHAINIRDAIGISSSTQQFDKTLSGPILLPIVPKSYIDYTYASFAGVTSRNDYGFSILRKMEEDYQFYFDFFHSGLEKAIEKLTFKYKYTTIRVSLDQKDTHLMVPDIPEEYQHKLLHIVKGYGGEYRININHGAALRLQDEAVNGQRSKWIIDSSFTDGNNIVLYHDRLEINGVSVYTDNLAKSDIITIVNKTHEQYQVDLANSTITLLATDASQWLAGRTINVNIEGIERQITPTDTPEDTQNALKQAIDSVTPQVEHEIDWVLYGMQPAWIREPKPQRTPLTPQAARQSLQKALQEMRLTAQQDALQKALDKAQKANKQGEVENAIQQTLKEALQQVKQDGVQLSPETYFNAIANKGHLDNSFIVVNHYQHNRRNVGRAYFDTKNNRMILTTTFGEKYRSGILSAVDNQYAYFFSDDRSLAWSVDIENGSRRGNYDFSVFKINNTPAKIINMWQENNEVLIETSITLDDNTLLARFAINGSHLDLKKLSNNRYLLDEIANTATTNLPDKFNFICFLTRYQANKSNFDFKLEADDFMYNAQILEIDGKDSHGINRRYWIRKESNTLIKPNLEASFTPFIDDSGNEVKWMPPDDIALVGNLFDSHQTGIFFFYSKKENKLYRQEGLGQDELDSNQPTAKILTGIIEPINNIVVQDGNLLVISEEGTVDQVNIDGHIRRVSLNEKWLSGDSPWWERIDSEYKNLDHPITLLGLRKNNDNSIIPAWYFNEKTIIAHTLPSSNNVHLVGFASDNQGAYIFDYQAGKLYYQPSIEQNALLTAFGENRNKLNSHNSLPDSVIVYPELTFKNVSLVKGGILLTTGNNGVIYHALSNDYDVRNKQTLGDSFVINGTDHDDILHVNKIAEVKSLVISGGEGKDTYKLDYQDWQKYDVIIIDNYAKDKKIDRIELSIDNDLEQIFIKRNNHDLIIFDVENKTSLILREVYGSNAEEYLHFDLRINNGVNHITADIMINYFSDKQLSVPILTLLDIQIDRDFNPIYSKDLAALSEQMSQSESKDLVNIPLDEPYKKSKFSASGNVITLPESSFSMV
uniref:TcdA/TcdB toxin pore forming domain-containing protein n=1 Tax=Providencia stuartii TaxID=588 RepID=A0AAI9DA74_PROST|nr:hypothetical protein [Providencia stuartii]